MFGSHHLHVGWTRYDNYVQQVLSDAALRMKCLEWSDSNFFFSNKLVNITLALGPLPNGERIEARWATVLVEVGSGASDVIRSDVPTNPSTPLFLSYGLDDLRAFSG